MISRLRGTIMKEKPGAAVVDVSGVGYGVQLPAQDWEMLRDGATANLWITTYVREDRLSLFGFLEKTTRTLFEELIECPGIGPRLGLELCAVPRGMLLQAINEKESGLLRSIKGIGAKTAEKLLLELRSLSEKHPDIFLEHGPVATHGGGYDRDTIDALTQLGYSTPDILRILPALPKDLQTTSERVTAALRAL